MSKIQACPVCGNVITPTLLQYLPPKGGYKQYECPHCGAWLTISGSTKLGVAVYSALFALPCLMTLNHFRQLLPKSVLLLLLAVFFVLWLYIMALIARRIAVWVAEPQ